MNCAKLVHDARPAVGLCSPSITILALTILVAAITVTLSACGGSASGGSQQSSTLSGNWQFTMAPQTDGNPGDPTFNGGLQGGFLLQNNSQNNDSASGQTVYSVMSPTAPSPCNSGSAPITVTMSGQNVTLTEVAGTQTFTLTGTLSSDGSTMMGTYNSTAGTAADGSVCGYAETGLSWRAISVPPLTGFHPGELSQHRRRCAAQRSGFYSLGITHPGAEHRSQ